MKNYNYVFASWQDMSVTFKNLRIQVFHVYANQYQQIQGTTITGFKIFTLIMVWIISKHIHN
jgi:hypothetical protein